PPRTWSSDLHKVLGVYGLPFQLFYAWSGAMLAIGAVLVEPALVVGLFDGDRQAAIAARGASLAGRPQAPGVEAPLPDLDALVARARVEVPGMEPRWIGVEQVGDQASAVSMFGYVPGVAFAEANLVFAAADGRILRKVIPAEESAFQRFEAWF